MHRYLLALTLSVALLPTSVVAQDGHAGTPEQQRACRPDVLRHCRGVHDDQVITECLRANAHSLRPACRQVLEGGGH
jgi:Cysteine rich repeat